MFINCHSDGILRRLRLPGETGYKIPRGGMDAVDVVYIHTLSRPVLVPFLLSPDQHFDSLTICFWYYVY